MVGGAGLLQHRLLLRGLLVRQPGEVESGHEGRALVVRPVQSSGGTRLVEA